MPKIPISGFFFGVVEAARSGARAQNSRIETARTTLFLLIKSALAVQKRIV
jgi:hypothetical protein